MLVQAQGSSLVAIVQAHEASVWSAQWLDNRVRYYDYGRVSRRYKGGVPNTKYGMGTSTNRSSSNNEYYTMGGKIPGIRVDGICVSVCLSVCLSVCDDRLSVLQTVYVSSAPTVTETVTVIVIVQDVRSLGRFVLCVPKMSVLRISQDARGHKNVRNRRRGRLPTASASFSITRLVKWTLGFWVRLLVRRH